MKGRETLIGLIIGFVLTSSLSYYKANDFFTAPKIDVFEVPTVDLNNTPVKISEIPDKNLIVNIWATWCRPCIKEMPYLSSLRDRLDSENWQIILISDEEIDKIKSFKDKFKVDLELIKAQEKLKDYGIKGYPTTYVINKDRVVEFSRNGELLLFQTEFENSLKKLDATFVSEQ
ncbi:MAG: TlpA disulfide reductase family protein [Bacteroidota bacterium]